MPRFSIVIPTRQRADTLAFTIETALAQTCSDFEVVIQNNGNDPATRNVATSFASPRIVLNGSAEILPMADNWEAALAASSGEYVAFIGDDDGIMPDACAICDELMPGRSSLGALHWTPHNYDWPTSLRPTARNRLVVNLPGSAKGTICDSRNLLLRLYDGTISWTSIPLIYNGSFVRRTVIEKVKAHSGGRYFAGQIPDVHSGIADLWAMERFLHIDRPLSVCGASGHSNGNAHFVGGKGHSLQKRFHSENPALCRNLSERFLDTTNMELTIASALMLAKEMFFGDDPEVSLNMRNLLLQMGMGANRDPALYDQTMSELRQIGQKYGIDTSELNFPPKRQRPDISFQGPVTDTNGRTTHIVVNGETAGLATVADAVRLVVSMTPLQTPAQLNALLPGQENQPSVTSRLVDELADLVALMASDAREAAVRRYFGLTDTVVHSRCGEVDTQCRLLPGPSAGLSMCHIPATRRGRSLALFIPDILTLLPHVALRVIPLLSWFDLTICEWPGHGAAEETANVTLATLAAEFTAFVDHILPTERPLFVIGESIGGLLALMLARLRPERVHNVILIDTPFQLVRPSLAADIVTAWRQSSTSPYLRRLLREVVGLNPDESHTGGEHRHFTLLKDAPFNCALIPGGDGAEHATPSAVTDEDLAALHAINPSLLTTARITGAGHHVLRDDPQNMMAELNKLLVRG